VTSCLGFPIPCIFCSLDNASLNEVSLPLEGLTLCWDRLDLDCRGRRPGIPDMVHVLRVRGVKLGFPLRLAGSWGPVSRHIGQG
jgi:hypothetical protein